MDVGGERVRAASEINGGGELRAVAFVFGAALPVDASGCAGMSPADNARFQAVVAKNVSVGMPFVTAIEHLVRAGFSCDQTSSAPEVTCARSSQSILPYSCVQRLDLATDVYRQTVVAVTPRPSDRCGRYPEWRWVVLDEPIEPIEDNGPGN
jgi:hypothetical protein